MVEKVDVPVDETPKESQEYIDKMVEKADQNNPAAQPQSEEENKTYENESKILGKFNTQDELIKSYQELEKKLGSQTKTEEKVPLKAEEKPEGLKGIDFNSISNEFEENGKLSDDTYKNLESAGLPKSYVDNYIEGLKASSEKFENQAYDLTGGKDNYSKMIGWVKDNLTPDEVKMFNDGIEKDNTTALYTIKGMYARYSALTSEPNLVSAETGQASSGVRYESVAQMKADMANPKYQSDPAFRKEVQDKLSRSEIL
tara:strand:+ start:1689 stop:2459 length:771 start_codon:yes stop_codon:yes gene_type:complete